MTKKILKLALCFFAAFLCSCTKTTPPSPIPEVLGNYLKYHANADEASKGYNAYFDLSDGMLAAYGDLSTKEKLKSVINKITGNKNCQNVYALKDGAITKLETNQTELYNYILNPASYAKVAPIEETLKDIVDKGVSAFFITDFEEYSNGVIQQQNYAKQYFVKWLKSNKDITFFVTDYVENGKPKHLYFTVFDSGSHALLKEIEDAFDGQEADYKRFNLTSNNVRIEYTYPSTTKGGCYHDASTGEDIVSCTDESGKGDCFTKFESYQAEYYPFNASWNDIVKNAKDLAQPGNTPQYTDLITGPKADLTSLSGYNVTELDVKVTNMQADFTKYAGYYEYTKDKTVNVDENGKLLPEYDYTKGGGGTTEVEDMLEYTGSIKDGVSTLNINFDDDFTGTNPAVSPSDLLRVDVVIEECSPKYDIVSQLFSWPGNNSLEQAVRNTLQEVNPKGKTIYTFFMRDSK